MTTQKFIVSKEEADRKVQEEAYQSKLTMIKDIELTVYEDRNIDICRMVAQYNFAPNDGIFYATTKKNTTPQGVVFEKSELVDVIAVGSKLKLKATTKNSRYGEKLYFIIWVDGKNVENTIPIGSVYLRSRPGKSINCSISVVEALVKFMDKYPEQKKTIKTMIDHFMKGEYDRKVSIVDFPSYLKTNFAGRRQQIQIALLLARAERRQQEVISKYYDQQSGTPEYSSPIEDEQPQPALLAPMKRTVLYSEPYDMALKSNMLADSSCRVYDYSEKFACYGNPFWVSAPYSVPTSGWKLSPFE